MGLTQLVIDAIEEAGGEATTQQIYSYVVAHDRIRLSSFDFHHRVRSVLSTLKMHERVALVAPKTYKLLRADTVRTKHPDDDS